MTHLSLPSKYIDRAATFNVSSSFLFPPPPVGVCTPPPPHSSLHCASPLPNQQPLKLVTTRLKVDNCSGFVSLLHQAVPHPSKTPPFLLSSNLLPSHLFKTFSTLDIFFSEHSHSLSLLLLFIYLLSTIFVLIDICILDFLLRIPSSTKTPSL